MMVTGASFILQAGLREAVGGAASEGAGWLSWAAWVNIPDGKCGSYRHAHSAHAHSAREQALL